MDEGQPTEGDDETQLESDYELAQRLMANPALLAAAEALAASTLETDPADGPLSTDEVRAVITYLKGFGAILHATLPERLVVVLQESIGNENHGDLLRHGDEGLALLAYRVGILLNRLQHQLPPGDA